VPINRAITLISPVDGRVMFVIPWRGRVVVGTTDTDFAGTADEVFADAADAEYLCASVNEYFPRAGVTPKDVIATWAGLRPLIRGDEHEDESEVSREHELFVRDDGMLIIAGGKLTTYRRMGKEVVRAAVKWLGEHDEEFARDVAPRLGKAGTKERPLPGAQGLEEPNLAAVAKVGQELVEKYGLDADAATHLCGVYGVRAVPIAQAIAADRGLGERLNEDAPYLWAEVDFAVEHDLARTVDDVLSRRVPILLVGRDQGLDVCERVADRMQRLLGWSDDEKARQLAAYRTEVAESRRFRTT
jgi:glycerol-3-phosphate dehydrogenase